MPALPEHQGDYALLAIGVLGASTSPPLIAAATAPALAIAFWRTGAAAVILAPFLFARGIGAVPPRALKLALLAGAALAIHFGTFIPSLSYTSVSSATALVCSQAVWAALLGRVLGERLPARAWVGVGVCFAGVLLITGVDVSLDARALVGDALAFAGGVFGGVYIVTGGFVRRDLNTLAYTVICYGTCAVLLLVVCLVSGVSLGGYSELDQILERERAYVAQTEDDDEDFFREMSGKPERRQSYGFDKHTAEKLLGDFKSHKQHGHKKRKKSFLDELFD